jgi:hypothetical protein
MSKSRPRPPAKSRPRPPAIRTLILDCEVYQQHNKDAECDISRTASTDSSEEPIMEEVGLNVRPRPLAIVESNARPRPPATKTLILYYESYHHDKGNENAEKGNENAECDLSRTVSTESSSGESILEEADLMNQ